MPLSTARSATALACLLALSGCSVFDTRPTPMNYLSVPVAIDPRYDAMEHYGKTVPAIPAQYLTPENVRQVVPYFGPERPGTLVVDPAARFLYLVMENGEAMRYRVGVGRAGYAFEGEATVGRKAPWPRWTPTDNMLARDPERYGRFADGVPGGYDNPLGAHALYLFRNGRDTYYRIHGTNEPHSIGNSVSAGCIRMFNQDVIDLAGRVPDGTRVLVRPSQEEPLV